MPEIPEGPGMPEIPKEPCNPEILEGPGMPETPPGPCIPEALAIPDMRGMRGHGIPEIPEGPGMPKIPAEGPGMPEIPGKGSEPGGPCMREGDGIAEGHGMGRAPEICGTFPLYVGAPRLEILTVGRGCETPGPESP